MDCSHGNSSVLQGNKAQLEEVWEKDDKMDASDFDPRTLFFMHGNCCVVVIPRIRVILCVVLCCL